MAGTAPPGHHGGHRRVREVVVGFEPVDVWGIDGTAFLVAYWAVAAVIIGAGYVVAFRVDTQSPPMEAHLLRPHEIGYLTGGAWGAIFVSLAWLRATEAIDANQGALSYLGWALPHGNRLDRAIAWAATRGVPVWRLAEDRAVVRAVRQLRHELVRAGLVMRSHPRLWLAVAGAALVGAGTARFVSGPVADLPLMVSVFAVAAASLHIWHLLAVPLTGSGHRVLAELKAQWSSGPDWQLHRSEATYADGPYDAAMRVALTGPPALLKMDPEFAHAAGLTPQSPGTTLAVAAAPWLATWADPGPPSTTSSPEVGSTVVVAAGAPTVLAVVVVSTAAEEAATATVAASLRRPECGALAAACRTRRTAGRAPSAPPRLSGQASASSPPGTAPP
jgi:uncharacterized protein (TIGR04222 family)